MQPGNDPGLKSLWVHTEYIVTYKSTLKKERFTTVYCNLVIIVPLHQTHLVLIIPVVYNFNKLGLSINPSATIGMNISVAKYIAYTRIM